MRSLDDERFRGVARLYGAASLSRLRAAHVCVVGMGGVGSWAVEALARSGLGRLTLVDLDDVCVGNINRQLHALENTIGSPKVEAMARRVQAINPECLVHSIVQFFDERHQAEILSAPFDHVIDAIDHVPNKCRLITSARERNLPVVVCGGAGGRRDPTAIRVQDLAFTSHDRLLRKVRDRLRREHGFSATGGPFGIECVYSTEAVVLPKKEEPACDGQLAGEEEVRALNCEWGLGSLASVTGTFGLVAAARVIERITGGPV